MKRHLITNDELSTLQSEWQRGDKTSKFLPFITKSKFLIRELNFVCPFCEKNTPDDWVRIELIEHPNNVDEFRGIGICCQTVTRYLIRFGSDGNIISLVNNQWRHLSIKTEKTSIWTQFIRWLRSVIRRHTP